MIFYLNFIFCFLTRFIFALEPDNSVLQSDSIDSDLWDYSEMEDYAFLEDSREEIKFVQIPEEDVSMNWAEIKEIISDFTGEIKDGFESVTDELVDVVTDTISDDTTAFKGPPVIIEANDEEASLSWKELSSEATGGEFVDNIFKLNSPLWTQYDYHLFCPRKNHAQCVYLSSEANRKVHLPMEEEVRATNELQIPMKNDCEGEKCCADGECTKYTGGHLTSAHTYSYGSFYFVAESAKNLGGIMQEGVHDAWTCFSLLRHADGREHIGAQMELSMCIASNFRNRISLIWRYGEVINHKVIRVNFDPTYEAKWYRIDWHPNRVTFHADNQVLHIVKPDANFQIPDAPLRIKTYILPQKRDETISDAVNPAVAFNMYVFRIAYTKLVHVAHDELFLQGETKHSAELMVGLIILIGCLLGLICFVWQFHFWEITSTKVNMDGYQVLLENGYGGTHAPSE